MPPCNLGADPQAIRQLFAHGKLGMNIRQAVSEEDWQQVRTLFSEYFEWVRREPGIDLTFQGIQDELSSLPGAYSQPRGCLLLAEIEDQLAGCVAIRPLDAGACELKRMYVRPAFRGRGLGQALCEQIIERARSKGYLTIRLDTADTMHAARDLYTSLGFRLVEPYYDLPPEVLKRAKFMELSLLQKQLSDTEVQQGQ